MWPSDWSKYFNFKAASLNTGSSCRFLPRSMQCHVEYMQLLLILLSQVVTHNTAQAQTLASTRLKSFQVFNGQFSMALGTHTVHVQFHC